MEARDTDASFQARWSDKDLDRWRDMLASACDAIAGTSPDVMKSITVAGRLRGIEGEAGEVMVLGEELATGRGLHVDFKVDKESLTVQLSRRDGASDARSER